MRSRFALPLLAISLVNLAPAAAAQTCQEALGPFAGGAEESALPGQVDGAQLAGADDLVALRRRNGDALITVKGGNFAGADFRRARLHNICFLETDLAGSDWQEAVAPGAGFVRTDLTGARLRGARLPRVLFRDAGLEDVDAAGATLAGGRLDGGWFEGSLENLRLDGADLTGFRFDCGITLDDGCPVYHGGGPISLRGANLAGANLFGVVDLADARIDGTEIGPGQLHDLRRARIEGPIRLRGGDAIVEVSPDDYLALLPHIVDPLRPEPPSARAAAPPAWVRPGAIALFVDAPLLFDEAFRGTPLYRRLLPALIGASASHVAVRVRRDGGLDAAGESVGANAHTCTLAGEGLLFDPATGYYSGPHQTTGEEPPEWRERQMPVLGFVGDRVEVYRSGRDNLGGPEGDPRLSDYASCGMRAAFAPMVRVPGEAAAARRMLESLAGR